MDRYISLKNLIRRFCLICLFLFSGCHALNPREAGAPEPSYDVDADLEDLRDHFKTADSIKNFYAAPSKENRNELMSGRLAMININYLDWLRTLTADKQLLDTATDVLLLSLNLAGTAVGGAAAKTTLAAISAGIAGSKTAIDKHYFYEKTISALIAAMNAQRASVLVKILRGMNAELTDYPFEQGLANIQEYYQAGTLAGAVAAVQADAGAKQQDANERIELLAPTTEERVRAQQDVRMAISELRQDRVPAARKAIEQFTGSSEPARDLAGVRKSLITLWRNVSDSKNPKEVDAFMNALTDNGILK